jgi:hypothetical protein
VLSLKNDDHFVVELVINFVCLGRCKRYLVYVYNNALLHNLQLALVEYLGQDSKQRIVVKIQLQREYDPLN